MPAYYASDRSFSPADLYLEGSDQHRGWFQSSLLTGIGAYDESPYRQVLTHGFTVDGEGRKMSKSIGNIIPAKKAMNDMGADILRLWVASADYRNEIAASDEIFKRTSDTYRRIRNTARFLLANLAGFEPTRDAVSGDDMLPLDRWIVSRRRNFSRSCLRRMRLISSITSITRYITSAAASWAASTSMSSKTVSTPRKPIQ